MCTVHSRGRAANFSAAACAYSCVMTDNYLYSLTTVNKWIMMDRAGAKKCGWKIHISGYSSYSTIISPDDD